MFTVRTTNVYVLCGDFVLLIRRSPNDQNKPLWWESPAGHVDIPCQYLDDLRVRNEALRELREETGILADPLNLVHLPRFSNPRHMSYLLRMGDVRPAIKLSEEHCDYVWSHVHAKPPSETRYEVRRFLRDMFNA